MQGLGERYTRLQFLGEGAAGTVFKALDTLLQRWVALKVLKGASSRALAEARAQAQVEHPNVCRVYEVGRGFIVMQLVEGPNLAELGPALGLRAKVACLLGIAHGVQAAHARGLLHLDLKLGNILLQPEADGTFTPVVGDFGMVLDLADGTAETCPLGTPPYASPEQLAGDPRKVGPASDVYALGVLAYILLSGRAPFPATSLEQLLSHMVRTPPVPLAQAAPALPRDLARVVHRCLEKDPARRYAGAADLADEFDRFLHARPLKVMGRSLPYRALRCLQRNRSAAWSLGLGAAALLASLGIGLWRESRIAQRTDWDRHFQKRVEEARVELDRAYRRPPHDIRGDLDQIQRLMDEIREGMARRGPLAEGPAHLALGQLLLVRDGQSAEAARHFQAAWDGGLRTEGARTWLAYALLRQYEETLGEALRNGVSADTLDREALRARFLEPARAMLKGRGDTDQARLAHMADLVEARLVPLANRADQAARAVQLAAGYRRRAPQDLDALLEEIEARFRHIELLLQADDPAPLEPAWEALAACLREGAALAPSHPRMCLRLAQSCQIRLDRPEWREGTPEATLADCGAWIAQGLKAAPDDPGLKAAVIERLSREALDGHRPRKAVHGEMLRTLSEAGRSRAQVLSALFQHVARGLGRGLDLLPFGLEVLTSLQAVPGEAANRSVYGNFLMELAIVQGQDPQPVRKALDTELAPWMAFTLAFNDAAWRVKAGQARAVDLERLRALQGGLEPKPPHFWMWELVWEELYCRAGGTPDAWGRLRGAFERQDWKGLPEEEAELRMRAWTAAGIALVARDGAEGRDPGPDLDRMEAGLRRLRGATRASRWRRDFLQARYRLCAIRVGRGSREDTEEAIRQVGNLLACFGPRTRFSDLFTLATQVPGKGELLQLRGELRMEAARRLLGAGRQRMAREAGQDLAEALVLCPGLREVLFPLRREALRLSRRPFDG